MTDKDESAQRSAEGSKPPIGLIIAGIAAAIIAVFILSNTQDTEVTFGWLDATLPLWSVIIISVALGAVIGWTFSAWRRRRKGRPRT